MKTLHYRRHSLKDKNNHIGPEGLELARSEGGRWLSSVRTHRNLHVTYWISSLFYGEMIRTLETGYAFVESIGGFRGVPTLMPPIKEIGTEIMSAQMANDEFKAAVKAGSSYMAALRQAHLPEQVRTWAKIAGLGVIKMFDQMANDEYAIAFGHSPIIELAAQQVSAGLLELPDGWDDLKELDGLVFVQSDGGLIGVTKVIRAVREPTQG